VVHFCDYGCGQEAKYQFKNGNWCCSKYCRSCPVIRKKITKKLRTPFKGIKEFAENEGYEILSKEKEYKNQFSYLKFRCPEGHEYLAKWSDFKHLGIRCPICYDKKIRTPFEDIIKIVENKGYTLISKKEDYKNACSKLWFRCSEGHEFLMRWDNFKNGGQRCPECYNEKRRNPSLKTRKKMRLSRIKDIESKYGQTSPNYSSLGCKLIKKYGEENSYNFQHAENGGEYHIKELGYWVDGYDKEKNVVIEVDEPHHFDKNGNLKEKDVLRQKEIIDFLGCKFIRLRI